MKKMLVIGALLLGAASVNSADMVKGDPEAGAQKIAVCGACHGGDGNSMVPMFPKLAGLGEKYLLKQLQHIRSGLRPVAQMAGQVDNLTDQDLADIAAFYDQKPRSVEKADPAQLALGEKVYRSGVAERNVAACIACHGPRGAGNGPAGFPALGGQHADYVVAQLKAYRKGYEDPTGRVTGGDTMVMRSNAFGMSDMEIAAVAAYVSGLQ
ncbi:MAG: cytochrome c [Congregibacter sp.]